MDSSVYSHYQLLLPCSGRQLYLTQGKLRYVRGSEMCSSAHALTLYIIVLSSRTIGYGTGYLHSSCAHRRRTLAYLQSRDEPMNAFGSSHMTK